MPISLICEVGHAIEGRSRLFKPFYSGKGGKGLGLGLWISHNIIEGHGGHIEVESKVGEGTTFTLNLPAYQQER
jgi:two-component system NtrC family sensor kinase